MTTTAKAIELAKLQTVWRTALQRDQPVIIACPTIATARNIRFRLYNAVKSVRDGRAEGDPELVAAVDALQVSLREEPPAVIVQRKQTLELVDAALSALGIDPASAKTSEELEIEASMRRMAAVAAEAAGASPAPRPAEAFGARAPGGANPFFQRGDKPGSST
jgi:hypothetical protein